MYYVIVSRGDGEPRIYACTKTDLLECLRQRDWGKDPDFLGSIPDPDMNYWGADNMCGATLLVIKGEIVQPHPIETVRAWDIP